LDEVGQTEGEVALQAALVELVEVIVLTGFQIRVVVQHPQQDARRDDKDRVFGPA